MPNIFDDNFEFSKYFPVGLFSRNQCDAMKNPHHHQEYEIFYVDKGNLLLGMDGEEYDLTPGNTVYIPSGTEHYVKNRTPEVEMRYYAIIFDKAILGTEGDSIVTNFERIRVSKFISLSDEIINKIQSIYKIPEKQHFYKLITLKACLFDIASHILATRQYITISNKNNFQTNTKINAIETSVNYIKKHYRENISLEDILKLTSYSKSHFIRLFKKNTGLNFTQFINKYRIERACVDLLYSSKNITEVATENGFNNIQYFSKTFKEYMNCTPKKYQQKGQSIMLSEKQK